MKMKYVVCYSFGGRWVTVPHAKRFWESRLWDTKAEALDAVEHFKKDAPFLKYRVLSREAGRFISHSKRGGEL